MIPEKDLAIISHLRKNARKKVTTIAKEINMPVTTIYDKLHTHSKKGLVKKHVALLDYAKLGYNTNVMLAIKADINNISGLQAYLKAHACVNSLYRIGYGYDFLADVVFEDMSRFDAFIQDTKSQFNIEDLKVFNIIQEIKKEEFLSN